EERAGPARGAVARGPSVAVLRQPLDLQLAELFLFLDVALEAALAFLGALRADLIAEEDEARLGLVVLVAQDFDKMLGRLVPAILIVRGDVFDEQDIGEGIEP